MKRERSLKRIDDEKNLIEKKTFELDSLRQQIEQIRKENFDIEQIFNLYQRHRNFLAQVEFWTKKNKFSFFFLFRWKKKVVDQTDRFQSIDEMIEKFETLSTSYQVIWIEHDFQRVQLFV